jgi:hypothetical protein
MIHDTVIRLSPFGTAGLELQLRDFHWQAEVASCFGASEAQERLAIPFPDSSTRPESIRMTSDAMHR